MDPINPRIRPFLLILLWIWAGCVFVVLDLFFTVEEFDSVRPRAPLYRGMREAAHEWIGEPCADGEARYGSVPGWHSEPAAGTDPILEVKLLLQRARTAQGAEREAALRALASSTDFAARRLLWDVLEDPDPEIRAAAVSAIVRAGSFEALRMLPPAAIAELAAQPTDRRSAVKLRATITGDGPMADRLRALEALAEGYGEEARESLLVYAGQECLEPRLRRDAVRLLARTGSGAQSLLVRVLEEMHDPAVRAGALYGLAELGVVQRVVDWTNHADFRQVAIEALTRARPGAALARAVRNRQLDKEVRVALVRALGYAGVHGGVLTSVFDDKDAGTEVRIAAVTALADLRDGNQLPLFARATEDPDPEVAEAAWAAWQRRSHSG